MAAKSNNSVMRRSEQDPNSAQGANAAARREHPSPTRQWITDQVRRMYNEVVNEPLPDSFKDLLAKLDDDEKVPEPKSAKEPGN